MKLAIIELDNVISDVTARFAQAERVRLEFLATCTETPPMLINAHIATDIYWKAVFDTANVPLDTLIEGVDGDLIALELQGYGLIYLTSRPEAMRKATEDWLCEQGIEHRHPAFGNILIMRPSAFFHNTKTSVWKAGMVQTVAAMFEADEVLFVDEITANRDKLKSYKRAFQLRCASSLDIAVNGEPEDAPLF